MLELLAWRIFTTKLEPIFSKKCNSEPRRLSAVGRTRPDQKTLCIFFVISPAVIFLEMVKGVLVGCAVALATLAATVIDALYL